VKSIGFYRVFHKFDVNTTMSIPFSWVGPPQGGRATLAIFGFVLENEHTLVQGTPFTEFIEIRKQWYLVRI